MKLQLCYCVVQHRSLRDLVTVCIGNVHHLAKKKILSPVAGKVNFDDEENAATEYSLLKSIIKTCA